MKYFWHIVASINTLLFALLVFGLYTGDMSINTDSWISGDIGVDGSVDTKIQEMPTVDVRTY